MCFGQKTPKPQATAAPAPAPPSATAEEQPLTAPRKAEDEALFGTDQPTLRVDRSVASAGTTAGGSGLRM